MPRDDHGLGRKLRRTFAVLVIVAGSLAGALAAPAPIEVTGLGWWQGRETRRTLERLLGEERGPQLDANSVEDAAFLLMSQLTAEGYLRPMLTAILTTPEGGTIEHVFDASLSTYLPRPLTAKAVRFAVRPGVRSRVGAVEITGLTTIERVQAEQIFRPERGLIPSEAGRRYSPDRLRRGLDQLQEELRLLGYAEATVTATRVEEDERTGEVRLFIAVNEGPRWEIAAVDFRGGGNEAVSREGLDAVAPGTAWTSLWSQDLAQEIRRRYHTAGYPDVTVRIVPKPDPAAAAAAAVRPVAVAITVEPGLPVRVGAVRFEGSFRTRERVLRRRIQAEAGDPLDPMAWERVRYRLGQLGVFETVDLRFDPSDGAVRDPVFTLEEAPAWEAGLLAGYGSYERIRGGIEFRQSNVFGRAHQSRLLLVQSLKSSRGEYGYTVPELFGERLDGSVRLFGLEREERAFLRQEYGGNVTLRRPVPWLRAEASVGLTYQALRSRENELTTRATDDDRVTVASADLALFRDTRDNPLRPRQGYRAFMQVEAASRALGGEVDYQRVELGAAYHRPLGRGQWLHLSLTHGVLTTLAAADDAGDPPVNKRFFPGGDGSIRGYASGSASPRAPDGRFIGAKAYLLANLEYELALVGNWTGVIFVDGLGTAARLGSYPFDEELASAGVGIRYQSLVGPLRLEYGRNLNPRVGDPSGTLHFSVGFPF